MLRAIVVGLTKVTTQGSRKLWEQGLDNVYESSSPENESKAMTRTFLKVVDIVATPF